MQCKAGSDSVSGVEKPRPDDSQDERQPRRRAPSTIPTLPMSTSATPDTATPMSDDIVPDATAAHESAVTQAIPGLPDDIVVTHILFRSTWLEYPLVDPADLARLSVVSRGMRHAVAATGRKIQEMNADEAARLGCLSALKRMHRRGSLKFDEFLCWNAAQGNCTRNFEALTWLRMKGCPWDETTQCHVSMRLASEGNLEALKWLRVGGCEWNSETCASAAEFGHFEVLKWACENGCPRDIDTCANAAYRGDLEMLKWARDNDFPWDAYTCESAAEGGQLEALKWARENGCPWSEQTCEVAASGGNLEMLKWARENGCPWSERTCLCAACKGHLEILKWARMHGCPWSKDGCMLGALVNRHTNVTDWIRSCDFD
jgi:hypothetical protein